MGRKTSSGIAERKPGYSFADLLVLTEATKSNLLHWRAMRIIKPGVLDAGGSGNHSRYSALNVIEAQLAAAVNRLRVPIGTIHGALDEFRHFHAGMVAVNAEVAKPPGTINPPWWSSPERRNAFAKRYVVSYERYFSNETTSIWPTQAEVDVALEQVQKQAALWEALRTGPVMRGEPSSDSPAVSEFLGLFITGFDFDSSGTAAIVTANPPNLARVVKDGAIVIDLINVLWEVGQRCKRLGFTLEPW